jgi:hypothetical protein
LGPEWFDQSRASPHDSPQRAVYSLNHAGDEITLLDDAQAEQVHVIHLVRLLDEWQDRGVSS